MKEQWGVDWMWALSCTSRDPAALHFQQLCSKKEVAPFNPSVTKVRCEVQGVNSCKFRQYMAWAWAINQAGCRGFGFRLRFQKQPFTCSSPTKTSHPATFYLQSRGWSIKRLFCPEQSCFILGGETREFALIFITKPIYMYYWIYCFSANWACISRSILYKKPKMPTWNY